MLIFPFESLAQLQNPRGVEYVWNTDTTKRNVELSEIIMLLPQKSFPMIDFPAFVGKDEGMTMFFEHEPVISVEVNGKAKAYPLNMLTMHEMSNDTLGGIPILPTYCPLCNASVVFDRRFVHAGKDYILEFEVSGMLRKSDMVMFDRQTETWWQQLMGFGIVGDFAGEYLDIIPSLVISVEEFFTRYPNGQILSTKTGTTAEDRYGRNPYVNYDSIGHNPYDRFFDANDVDSRLPAMERVIDIRVGDDFKIYPWSKIAAKGVLQDNFKGTDIVFFHKSGTVSAMDAALIENSRDIGSVSAFSPYVDDTKLDFKKKPNWFMDKQSRSKWDITGRCFKGKYEGEQLMIEPHGSHFAFAWLAFHPESEIY
jgi:Protein of unknown function (DUF3179)